VTFITWLFYESTPALAGLLFVVLFVLLVYWRRTLRRGPFQIGAIVAIALLIVQALVVTKPERAGRIMKRVEAAVLSSNSAALADELSERFLISETGWRRAEFMEVVRRYLSWMDVYGLRRRKLEIVEVEPERFQIYVSYLVDARTKDFAWKGLSRWLITFALDDDDWRIVEIEPNDMGQFPVRGWRALPPPR